MFTASRIFILKLIFFIDINPLYFLETLRTCLSSGALDTIALIYNRHDSPCNVCYGKTSSRSDCKKIRTGGGMFPGNKDFSNSRKVAINYSRVPQAPDVMNLGRRFCRQKVLQVEGIYFHYQKKLLSQVLVPVTYTSGNRCSTQTHLKLQKVIKCLACESVHERNTRK